MENAEQKIQSLWGQCESPCIEIAKCFKYMCKSINIMKWTFPIKVES